MKKLKQKKKIIKIKKIVHINILKVNYKEKI